MILNAYFEYVINQIHMMINQILKYNNTFRKHLAFDITTKPVEVSEDEHWQCKYCDYEFDMEEDLSLHENKFHQVISSDEDTILERYFFYHHIFK